MGKDTKVGMSLTCLLSGREAGVAGEKTARRGRARGEVAKWGESRSGWTLEDCRSPKS